VIIKKLTEMEAFCKKFSLLNFHQ